MRRLAPVVLLLLFVLAAAAWTWPVRGPVLQTFSFDPAHPYGAGQHRGIAIGADAGASVLAPAAGVVRFAGTVPTNGKTITIETAGGLAVSLTHLGSIAVARDASVEEGAVVGTVGPSGTAEFDVPYVHLGIRTAAEEQGYLDPLGFLPVLAPPAPGRAGGRPPAAPAVVAAAATAPRRPRLLRLLPPAVACARRLLPPHARPRPAGAPAAGSRAARRRASRRRARRRRGRRRPPRSEPAPDGGARARRAALGARRRPAGAPSSRRRARDRDGPRRARSAAAAGTRRAAPAHVREPARPRRRIGPPSLHAPAAAQARGAARAAPPAAAVAVAPAPASRRRSRLPVTCPRRCSRPCSRRSPASPRWESQPFV